MLSEVMLNLYRTLVMYRLPFVRTDSGYHVPTTDEVIAGIKAYFDPVHLSSEEAAAPTGTTVGKGGDSQELRADIIDLLRGNLVPLAHPAFIMTLIPEGFCFVVLGIIALCCQNRTRLPPGLLLNLVIKTAVLLLLSRCLKLSRKCQLGVILL